MKRIAIVTPYGAEERLDNYAEFILAQSLVEKGYDVRLYTYSMHKPGYSKNNVYKGVPVYRCRHRFGVSPQLFASLIGFRPTVTLCFHPKNLLNFSAYVAARVTRSRFIVEIVGILHDPYIVEDVDNPLETLRTKPLLLTSLPKLFYHLLRRTPNAWNNYVTHAPTAHADTIIAINEHEEQYIQKIYARTAPRIYWCTPRTQELQVQKPLSKPEIPAHFLFFIGQVKRRKGWDTAIDALAALKAQHMMRHLVFVSPQIDLKKPMEYAVEKGVREQISFLSAITNEEKQWLYTNCDAVLVPSRYEGFGIPVFEAFLARKPICATDIPVFDEFLVHKKNAMLSPVGDGEALAQSVSELSTDPDLALSLVRAGIETAALFSHERMVGEYITLIEEPLSVSRKMTP